MLVKAAPPIRMEETLSESCERGKPRKMPETAPQRRKRQSPNTKKCSVRPGRCQRNVHSRLRETSKCKESHRKKIVELGGTTAKAVGDKIARKMKEVGTAVDFMAYFAVFFTAAEM